MKTNRKSAIVVGVLFICATVLSLLSSTLLGSAVTGAPDVSLLGSLTGAPDYLAHVAANGNQMILGALLELAAAVAVVLIPAAMFPILKPHNEGMALGYFGFRILEAITLFVGALSALLLLTLSQEYIAAAAPAASSFQTSGAVLLGARDWVFPLNPIVFGPGALVLYSVLYQSRLIPRWLSAWGLIGAATIVVFGLLDIFGTSLLYLAIPIGVQEMVMA